MRRVTASWASTERGAVPGSETSASASKAIRIVRRFMSHP